MKILALDTSGNVASAAIIDEGKLICESILNHKKTHSEKIMPMIDALLSDSETDISEIDLFAAAIGPGSFTGLRIGVATAKALAHATGKGVLGICTLEGLAYNLFGADGLVCTIMDARRDQVYKEHIAPRALAIDECISELEGEKRVYFLGDAVPLFREKIKEELKDAAIFAPAAALMQRASSVASAAYQRREQALSYSELLPFYIRKSQAEREYEEKNK